MPKLESNPRTFGELLRTAEKPKKHFADTQTLAKREAQTWQVVENLLQSGYTAKNDDDAIALLSKLQH